MLQMWLSYKVEDDETTAVSDVAMLTGTGPTPLQMASGHF